MKLKDISVIEWTLVATIIVILVVMVRFAGDCKRKGGSPLFSQHGAVCLAPGVVIP